MKTKIRVAVKDPGKPLKVELMKNDIETLQTMVGGWVEGTTFLDMMVLMNEDAITLGLPPSLRFDVGQYVLGTVVFISTDWCGNMDSLSDKQIDILEHYIPLVSV